MLFKSVLGITLGEKRLCAVWIKGTLTGSNLESSLTAAFDSHMGLAERCEKAEKLIADFILDNKIGSCEIRLGISRELVIMRSLKLPLAVKENLRSTLTYEMEKYVPLAVEDLYFDYHVHEVDKKEKWIRVLLAVVKKEDAAPLIALSKSLLCGAVSLEASTSGIAGLLRVNPPIKQKTFAYLFFDDNDVDMGVVEDGTIAASYHHNRDAPDKSDKPDKKDKESLSEFIIRRFENIRSWAPVEPGTPLLVCGSEISDNTIETLKENSNLEVITLDINDFGLSSHSLIKAHGLALSGMHNLPAKLNLLPEKDRGKPNRARLYVLAVLSVLIILTAVFWAGSAMIHQHSLNKKLDTELLNLTHGIQKIDNLLRTSEALERKLERLNQLRSETVLISDVLLEVAKVFPDTAWVEQFNYAKGKFRIEGNADSASDLLTRLEKTQLFHEVVFSSAITRKQGKEHYRIGFKVEQ